MRKWLWVVPFLILAGCSRTDGPGEVVQANAGDPHSPPGVLIPTGTRLRVRVDEPLNTRRNRAGDSFSATLESAVVVDGATPIPAGTRFTGRVTTAEPSGRTEGRAVLAVELDSFALGGKVYRVHTSSIERECAARKAGHAGFMGVGTGSAAAAGADDEPAGLAAESSVTFSLEAPLRI